MKNNLYEVFNYLDQVYSYFNVNPQITDRLGKTVCGFFKSIKNNTIDKIVEAIDLEEGKEGVRRVLWTIYQNPQQSLKNISQITYLPVPLVKKICEELTKHNLLFIGSKHVELSILGKEFVEQVLNFEKIQSAYCPTCQGKKIVLAQEQMNLLEKLTDIAKEYDRTNFNIEFNQSPCLLETSLRRALYIQRQGYLNRRILCLGDNDLSSLAMAVISPKTMIGVVDIDYQLIDFLNTIKTKFSFNIIALCSDLRKGLPKEFIGTFDAFITDPPYTPAGFTLFISRGIQALEPPFAGKYGYISYSNKPLSEMITIQKVLGQMGLVVRDLIPNFNEYYAATIIGGQGQFIIVEASNVTKPLISLGVEFTEPIYTGPSKSHKTDLKSSKLAVTEKGVIAIEEGLVENRILSILRNKPIISLQELFNQLNIKQKEFDAGIGELKRLDMLKISKGNVILLSSEIIHVNEVLETALKKIKMNPQAEINKQIVKILLKRQLVT
ncbi:MAG: bis-aminopropyl spermidine synthase family protein [Promethearchaeota archaeon]